MKPDYMPPKGETQGPRYLLRPENHEEQKLLTVLRDLMATTGYRLRYIGAEHSEKNVANMPAKPVTQIAFCLEDRDGNCPEEFRSGKVDRADPTRHISRTEAQGDVPIAAVMDGRGKMRVVRSGGKTIVEERETR